MRETVTPIRPTTPERLDDLAASWRRDLRAAGKAERTIAIYGQAVRFFAAWLETQGRTPTVDNLTKHAVVAWLETLQQVNQPQTVLTRYKGLRRFTRWLVAEAELPVDPMANLEQPKPVMQPVPLLTDEEVGRLLKATAGTDYRDRRDHAVLRVLFDCGLRISECASLTLDDVDLDLEVLHVIGKGRKPRIAPFGAKTSRAIDRYLRARRAHPHGDLPALWLGQRGGLTHDGIDEILKRRGEQAKVADLHAHRFRHTAAHRWLAAGGQERDLMRLMGWSSDAMLDRYGSAAATERAIAAAKRMRLGDQL